MDALHCQLFTLMAERWQYGITTAVDVTLEGRFYERFAITAWTSCQCGLGVVVQHRRRTKRR